MPRLENNRNSMFLIGRLWRLFLGDDPEFCLPKVGHELEIALLSLSKSLSRRGGILFPSDLSDPFR